MDNASPSDAEGVLETRAEGHVIIRLVCTDVEVTSVVLVTTWRIVVSAFAVVVSVAISIQWF